MSQTEITNRKPSSGPTAEAEMPGRISHWHGLSGSSIALLILPAIMLIAGIVMISYMSPIYSGLQKLDYDPAYQYLFNGAGLMKGYNPSHVDHPGTPVQILTGLISIVSWSVARLCGLTSLAFSTSIATNPEEYLRIIMTAFLVMNCIAIYWLGAVIARSTRFIVAGMACQAAYLLFGPLLFPRIFHAAPEAILCLSATALMAVLAPVLFADEDCSDRRAVAVGFVIGLGVTSKVIFFPLVLLTLLPGRRRPILIALSACVVSMLVLLSPVLSKLKRIFEWLFAIATHEGHHGSGTAGFLDWTVIPETTRLIASTEPILAIAAISVTATMLFSSSGRRRKALVLAAALGALIILVMKHYSPHYLMTAVAIAPAIIVWSISCLANRQSSYLLAATIALVVGCTSIANQTSAFAKERALRRENESAVNAVIAKYQNPVVIGAYRSGYKPWAVLFALAWSDLKFARLFPQTTAADSLTYELGPEETLARAFRSGRLALSRSIRGGWTRCPDRAVERRQDRAADRANGDAAGSRLRRYRRKNYCDAESRWQINGASGGEGRRTCPTMRSAYHAPAAPPSVTSTISGGTPRRNGMMLQPRPPETMTSQLVRAWP